MPARCQPSNVWFICPIRCHTRIVWFMSALRILARCHSPFSWFMSDLCLPARCHTHGLYLIYVWRLDVKLLFAGLRLVYVSHFVVTFLLSGLCMPARCHTSVGWFNVWFMYATLLFHLMCLVYVWSVYTSWFMFDLSMPAGLCLAVRGHTSVLWLGLFLARLLTSQSKYLYLCPKYRSWSHIFLLLFLFLH